MAGPAFLNVAARVTTALDAPAFEAFVRGVEVAIGRQQTALLSARPIDIDILYFDDLVADFGRFEVPQRYIATRPFNLVPLAEIAPDHVDPRLGKTIREIAAGADVSGIVRKARAMHFFANRQEEAPDVRLSLNRVGVSSVKHILRLNVGGAERVFNADFTMVADLRPDKAGVHMSRFSELLEAATLDVLARPDHPARVEDLVAQIAREIVTSQDAIRADVRVRADFGLERWTPVSGKRTEETYTLVGIAHADATRTRRLVGIEAEGMTACPCAQLMVREHSLHELEAAGFSSADAEPRARRAAGRHAQPARPRLGADRHRGRVLAITCGPKTWSRSSRTRCRAKPTTCSSGPTSSSSSTKPTRTRSSSRTSCAGSSRARSTSTPISRTTRSSARRKLNYESIHKHDAFAEAFGLFGEFRRELRDGIHVDAKTDVATWLGTRPSPVIA